MLEGFWYICSNSKSEVYKYNVFMCQWLKMLNNHHLKFLLFFVLSIDANGIM